MLNICDVDTGDLARVFFFDADHTSTMALELDHFLIITGPNAPQAQRLVDLGLVEGSVNNHPGQGTANRRFFFSDAMLELVYIRDQSEAVNGRGKRLRFAERAASPEASPFGLVTRGTTTCSDPPFPGWRYYPDYLFAGGYFHVGENSEILNEPLCVHVPAGNPMPKGQPAPSAPFSKVTELRISLPSTHPSAVLEAISQIDRVSLSFSEPHLMEFVFNKNELGQTRDIRPYLPLVIHW